MNIERQKDKVVILQPHLILESLHGYGCLELFCGMEWNNEMACINFLELLQLPMKSKVVTRLHTYDEQDCNNLVTRLYNAITCLYKDKLWILIRNEYWCLQLQGNLMVD